MSRRYPPHSEASFNVSLTKNACEFIKDRLYFVTLPSAPSARDKIPERMRYFFTTDNELRYEPFHRDFGPLNMAMLFRYCTRLSMLLKSSAHRDKVIFHWTSSDPADAAHRTNAAYLAAAYSLIILGRSPEEAYAPLKKIERTLATFRDASYSNTCEYRLPITSCMAGISQGLLHGWMDLPNFNLEEYEYYDRVENGDLNWVLPRKFIAFAGPHSEHKWDNGYPLLAPENYFDYFRRGGVTDIVRLNNVLYDKKRFEDAGFKHHDLFFVDGSIPPVAIRERFLEIAENAKGGIAIHCKAGLGRTGTLIALYMMKHYMLTAAECIAWLRVSRPGSVLGPQQFYLQDAQAEMWQRGHQIGTVRKEYGMADGTAAVTASLGGLAVESGKPRVYAAPETTAPVGVQQGDYLNAQKARRQGGGKSTTVVV
jgi:cell division cycle 14